MNILKKPIVLTVKSRWEYLLVATICLFTCFGPLWGQSIFSEIYGYEPNFVLPDDEDLVIKNVRDFGAVGDGITDDTQAFLEAMNSGQRFLYIPSGTYLLSEQIRMSYGMKRLFWIGERRNTTILKLADGSPGFDDPANPKPFIYTIAEGQQGEQNMHNYIQHLTIEIGKNNSGAIALNFHTNNTGGVKDVAIRASDPVNHHGFRGIGIQDWGAGPGHLRFVEIDGFETGVYINTDNHWTLEHLRITNCQTGLHSLHATSARAITTLDCNVGLHIGGPMALLQASVMGGNGGNAVVVSNNNVMIKDLKTDGYANAIHAPGLGHGSVADPNVSHWLGSPARHLWDPNEDKRETLNIPIEESPEYQYPQSPDQWTLISSRGDITAELQAAIDDGAEFIYLQGSTINSTIYVRNKVKKIMVLGEGAITLNTGSANPAFVIQDGEPKVVILEHIYENYGSNNSWTVEQATGRTLVFRHGSGFYRTTAEGEGGKLFMESVVGGFELNGVRAWMRDMNTELGGLDALNITINNSTAWILGQKTEDFSTKIKVVNGSFCELLGGTYRQNWDLQRVINGGIDPQDPVPLYLVDNAHASFAGFTTWGWSGEFAYDPVIREIRGETRRDLSRTAGGGSMSLYAGYSERPESAQHIGVEGIQLGLTSLTIILGQTALVPAGVLPADATKKKINWTSNNPETALVDEYGFVTALAAGTAIITATTDEGGFSATCEVTIPEFIHVTDIAVIPDSAYINLGEAKQLAVALFPANATIQTVRWHSNDTDIATVNTSGLVTGIGIGEVRITATSVDGGFTASCHVVVSRPATTGLKAYEGFNYDTGSLAGRNGGQGWAGPWTGSGNVVAPGLTYPGCQSGGNTSSISNTEAVRILSETHGDVGSIVWIGFILHEIANSSTIHFQLLHDDDIRMAFFRFGYDQWGLNEDASGDPDNLPWFNEKNQAHFWLFKLIFGQTNTNVTVWRDPDLSFEPTSGGTTISLPAFSFNKVRLTHAFPGYETPAWFDEIRIAGNFMNATNNNQYIPVESIALDPTEVSLSKGQATLIRATITPDNATNKQIVWSSDNLHVASVNQTGIVTAAGGGTAIITATTRDLGFIAQCTIHVTVAVTGISLDMDSLELTVGESTQLLATVSPNDADNKNVYWQSSDIAVATVDQEGMIYANNLGITVITASTDDGHFSANCRVKVNPVDNTSVNNIAESGFMVYPTIGNGCLRITYPIDFISGEIRVFNTMGTLVFYGIVMENMFTLDLTDQPPGAYFVQANNINLQVMQQIVIAR